MALETVSIIIPILNEECYIEKLIKSILEQDYDFSKIEIIFVDGNSTDKTVEIINRKITNNIEYRILYNPDKITPKSVNIGIKNSKNDIIIRLDAHSQYPTNYISKCVHYLNTTGADNVGCLVNTYCGGTIVEKSIAGVLTSKFGVGNSKFRLNSKSGYVDTVPYGTFRKILFEKIGYFNEELLRSEDNEFNYRIRKNGGKVYLFNDISSTYYPRKNVLSLLKMAFQNGKYATYTNYFIPHSMGIRHFVPLLFVISIIFGIIFMILNIKFIKICFFLELVLYLILDLIFSFKNIKKGFRLCILMCFLYPMFHISYGMGSIVGIGKIVMSLLTRRKTNE